MKKKLIEVALPLEAINAASAKEKSIRHGHPSTLHLWWARRPLAACRAVLFASLVDDPSVRPDEFPTEEAQEAERQRLFRIIEELVTWENTTNETVLKAARDEIMHSTDGNPPPVLDPFCGGGSIPLEAQRLGLEAHASDLNPVAVLITKALIEIPPKFANQPPVHPVAPGQQRSFAQREWRGAQGLAEDVRYFGKWMRDEAERRIGHLYPKVVLPKEYGGSEATVIAWLWARTVKCPNPACGALMPLVSSFTLATKKGKEAWIEPMIDRTQRPPLVSFEVRRGKGTPPSPPKTGRGAKFRCLVCSQSADDSHIKAEGMAGRMGMQLMAIVAEGHRGRVYLSATKEHEEAATSLQPSWKPTQAVADDPRNIWCINYGLDTFDKLFTSRQLVTLDTLCDLVHEVRKQVEDCLARVHIRDGERGQGRGSTYADAIATYLALAVDRLAMTGNSLVRWNSVGEKAQHAFGRQALPMVWDFAEPNFFADATGSINAAIELAADPLELLGGNPAFAQQAEASVPTVGISSPIVSTDPPYYDNVSYADLSDFFYVWLRRMLGDIYKNELSTLLVPKAHELVASTYRFDGSKDKARAFFEDGLGKVFARLHADHNPDYPLTVYYAFKQAESSDGGSVDSISTASTGWETMLEGLLRAGFTISGTWPIRTEMGTRMIASGTNALASSIVLVCRPRPTEAGLSTRRDFLAALKRELPAALRLLQHGNVAPVDLAQAAIGPGMAIFSRYNRVVESDGKPMRVRTALQLINQALDEVLTEQEGEYDSDTRWAIAWFEQHAHDEGKYGDAETLSKAKVTSVAGLVEAGFLASRGGKVRLLRRDELPADWNPLTDYRITVWEVTQQLIHALDRDGEAGAAALLRRVGALGETARDLAYRLYTTCERKGWAQEALAYNSLVVAWPQLTQRASEQVEGEQLSFRA